MMILRLISNTYKENQVQDMVKYKISESIVAKIKVICH